MKDDNEDDLKNKEDLYIGGRYKALDIFRFAVFFFTQTIPRGAYAPTDNNNWSILR